MINHKTRLVAGLLVVGLLSALGVVAAPPPQANEAAATADFANGHYQSAIVQYQRLLREQPDNVGHRTKLAKSYEITGNLEQARQHASVVLNQRSNNVEALLLMGRIHGRQQDWTTAKSYYERAVKADKSNARAHLGFSQALMELGDTEAAEKSVSEYRRLTGISHPRGQIKRSSNK